MAWTWVAENFNRSDRPLHGEPVGASSLTWASYLDASQRFGEPVDRTQLAVIDTLEPRPDDATSLQGSLLMTDVEPLAGGSSVLGVGVEATFTTVGTPWGSANFADLYAAYPRSASTGSGLVLETDNSTASLYHFSVRRRQVLRRPSVGTVSAGMGWPGVESLGVTATLASSKPKWVAGDVVRMEVVYGGNVSVYYNAVLQFTAATPAAFTSANTLVGGLVNAQWRTDNWQVGVLT